MASGYYNVGKWLSSDMSSFACLLMGKGFPYIEE